MPSSPLFCFLESLIDETKSDSKANVKHMTSESVRLSSANKVSNVAYSVMSHRLHVPDSETVIRRFVILHSFQGLF